MPTHRLVPRQVVGESVQARTGACARPCQAPRRSHLTRCSRCDRTPARFGVRVCPSAHVHACARAHAFAFGGQGVQVRLPRRLQVQVHLVHLRHAIAATRKWRPLNVQLLAGLWRVIRWKAHGLMTNTRLDPVGSKRTPLRSCCQTRACVLLARLLFPQRAPTPLLAPRPPQAVLNRWNGQVRSETVD
jgi:hypothetical protein